MEETPLLRVIHVPYGLAGYYLVCLRSGLSLKGCYPDRATAEIAMKLGTENCECRLCMEIIVENILLSNE